MKEIMHTIILIFHVLGATMIIGTAFVTLVIEVKHFLSKQMLMLIELLWKLAGITLGIQLLTGLALSSMEWDDVGKSPYFWIKMVLFFGVGSLVGVINRRRFNELSKTGKEMARGVSWSWIGLLLFVTIAALGVLIAETMEH